MLHKPEKKQQKDNIITYHSLIIYQDTLDAYKQIGVTLRKSGSIDFYYDWRLVETSTAIPGKKEYTAIDLDFANIHFKCLEKENEKDSKRVLTTYVCPTSWRQRIGMTSSTKLKEKTITIEDLKQKYDELIRKNEQ